MEPADSSDAARQAFDTLMEGRYVRALAMIDQLLAAEPDNGTYRCWHSHALLGLGNLAEALKAARRAVRLAPDLLEGYLALAWSASRLGRKQEAQQAFEMALTLSNRHPDVLVEYANFLATDRAPALAEGIAREAADAAPASTEAWRALGWTLFRRHRHDEAETCLERALALAPSDAAAIVCMIDLMNHTGRHERAAELADRLRENPATAGIADELHREAAARLRVLGRAHPRFLRFLPPVEEPRRTAKALLRLSARAVLWAGAIAAFVAGAADSPRPGWLLPLGGAPLLLLIGLLVCAALWHTRRR